MRGRKGSSKLRTRKLAYLASPYTPLDGENVEARVTSACQYAAKLMQDGYAVFAPIPHSHYIADHLPDELRFSHEFWMEQDIAVLDHCDVLVVLMLAGWKDSKGVRREIARALELNIPVEYHEYP